MGDALPPGSESSTQNVVSPGTELSAGSESSTQSVVSTQSELPPGIESSPGSEVTKQLTMLRKSNEYDNEILEQHNLELKKLEEERNVLVADNKRMFSSDESIKRTATDITDHIKDTIKDTSVITPEYVGIEVYFKQVKLDNEISAINNKIALLQKQISHFSAMIARRMTLITTLESEKSDEEKIKAIDKYYNDQIPFYKKVYNSLGIPIVGPLFRLLNGPLYRAMFYNPYRRLKGLEPVPVFDKENPVFKKHTRFFTGGKSKRKNSTKKKKTLRKKSL